MAEESEPYPEMTDDERREWDEWLASRPAHVRAAVERTPPGMYILKSTGRPVLVYGYSENCETGQVYVKLYHAQPDMVADVFGHTEEDLAPYVKGMALREWEVKFFSGTRFAERMGIGPEYNLS
jgi:hypothetical protein